jgi:hypothetical protein
MRLACLEREAQRFTRAEEVNLPYDFVDRSRSQPFCQRGLGLPFAEEIIH